MKNISNDFTTSPEISQLFGECIAIFFQYVLQSNFSNKNILRILELGPGKVLSGLVHKTNRDGATISINTLEDIKNDWF